MRVFLFDIDGTLISSLGAGKAAMEAALREAFGIAEIRPGIPYSGRTDRAIGRELLESHGFADTDANWQRLRGSYLTHLPDHLRRHRGRVLPGIVELLDELARRPDHLVGLLTGNTRAGAEVKLAHFGLWHRFAVGGYGDHHYCRNEVARIAQEEVGRHLGRPIPGERIWVFGDTPMDVACARAIGAKVVAVATGLHPMEELRATGADHVLPDLAHASQLLNTLF